MNHRAPLLLAFTLLAACASAPHDGPASFAAARGAWSDASGAISVDRSRVVSREEGDVVVRGFVREEAGGTWVLRHFGRIERWHPTFDRGALVLESRRLQRLSAAPPELRIEPLAIPAPSPLRQERVSEITRELEARNAREQQAMRAGTAAKTPESSAAIKTVMADNLSWLTEVVREIGWIDVGRFGSKPSSQATIILKHSGGHALPLVLAALPYIEHDLANRESRAYQSYEVFYDSLQLQLGGKQRFGTQLAADEEGNPYVLPVDDISKVDERRAAIGDGPLASYLEAAAKLLYGGKPVSLTPPEQ